MTKDRFIRGKIPIDFPLQADVNGICFSEEALDNMGEKLKNYPVVHEDKTVGILTGKILDTKRSNGRITYIAEVLFFLESFSDIEAFPELFIKESRDVDGVKLITNFDVSAIALV